MEKKIKFRGIYLLPNFLTIINISFGYLSILSVFNGKYLRAALWIILAAVIDGFDGIIARATKTQSDFGIQLDSLADAFSFGAAPSLLLYFWGFQSVGQHGPSFFFSMIFFIAGILRLARYNVLPKIKQDRKYFTGLTIPSASLLIAAIVLFHPQPISSKLFSFLLASLVVMLSLCMVSSIRYRNFLYIDLSCRVDIKTAFLISILIITLFIFPKIFLLSFFFLNVLSGPSMQVYNLFKKRKHKILVGEKTGSS